jgi:hypothetical protein
VAARCDGVRVTTDHLSSLYLINTLTFAALPCYNPPCNFGIQLSQETSYEPDFLATRLPVPGGYTPLALSAKWTSSCYAPLTAYPIRSNLGYRHSHADNENNHNADGAAVCIISAIIPASGVRDTACCCRSDFEFRAVCGAPENNFIVSRF